jgi:hypothetical protein
MPGEGKRFWLGLLWFDAVAAISSTHSCTEEICVCSCVAELAATAYADEARSLIQQNI